MRLADHLLITVSSGPVALGTAHLFRLAFLTSMLLRHFPTAAETVR